MERKSQAWPQVHVTGNVRHCPGCSVRAQRHSHFATTLESNSSQPREPFCIFRYPVYDMICFVRQKLLWRELSSCIPLRRRFPPFFFRMRCLHLPGALTRAAGQMPVPPKNIFHRRNDAVSIILYISTVKVNQMHSPGKGFVSLWNSFPCCVTLKRESVTATQSRPQ